MTDPSPSAILTYTYAASLLFAAPWIGMYGTLAAALKVLEPAIDEMNRAIEAANAKREQAWTQRIAEQQAAARAVIKQEPKKE